MDSKPRVIVFPFNLLAHYARSLEVADALRDDFDFYFINSKAYHGLIQQYGFKIIEYQHQAVDEVLKKAVDFNFDWINSHSIETMFDAQFAIVKKYKPDLLMSDTMLTLPMVSEYANIPLLSLVNGYLTNYYDDIRPVPYTHKAWPYQFKMKKNVWLKIHGLAERTSMKFVHKPIARQRKKLGLKQKTWLLDEFSGDFNLICDLPGLFPQKKLPGNYVQPGPVLVEPDKSCGLQLPWEPNDKRPLIYLSLGSSGEAVPMDFLTSRLADQYRFVVSGKKKPPEAEHVHYQPFVCFSDIANQISLFISHGGNGSIYQALSVPVPMLIIPAFFEQEWNAHRVTKTGIGQVLYPDATPGDVMVAVEQAIRKQIPEISRDLHREIQPGYTKINIRQAVLTWYEQIYAF